MNRAASTSYYSLKSSLAFAFLTGLVLTTLATVANAQGTGKIELDIVEEVSGNGLVCRMRLVGRGDNELRVRNSLFQNGWNLVESPLKFEGRPGEYTYEITAGPQFSSGTGGFTLDRKSTAIDIVRLPKHCDMQMEGWRGGDLLAFVKPEETAKWLVAEDLVMSAVVHTKAVEVDVLPLQLDALQSRWVNGRSYLDARDGSGLILHSWTPPRAVPDWVHSSKLIALAKENRDAHVEIQRMWARDTPIWLATGKVDSIQLLSNHLTYDGKDASEVIAPLDLERNKFQGPRGAGRMVEYLYWQMLETGLRIPPSAGSGFGKSPSPLGYNRVYVMTGNPSSIAWWDALRAGQSFVSNGPLLRAHVNGFSPGHVFTSDRAMPIELDIGLRLTVADPVEYLDVIFNGRSLYQARLDEFAKQGGKIPPLAITESGWLVIRVVTEREFTYRLATTAPFYFEFDGQPRISRSAVELFQRWLDRTSSQLAEATEQSRVSAQPYLESANQFWLERKHNSNAP